MNTLRKITSFTENNKWRHNNAINSDNKKRRAFVAPLFIAGYGERWAPVIYLRIEGLQFRRVRAL